MDAFIASGHRRRASEVNAVPEFGPHMDKIQLAPPQYARAHEFLVPASKSASMSCCTRRRCGKPSAVRCSSKTCPTSGAKCSSIAWNSLCSRSWDRARGRRIEVDEGAVRNGVGARPGANGERASGGRGTVWPAFRAGMIAINEGATGGREKWWGGCTSDGVEFAAKCTTHFCSRFNTVTALKFP